MIDMTLTGGEGARRLERFRFVTCATEWAAGVEPVVLSAIKSHAPVGKGPTAGKFRDSIGHRRHVTSTGVRTEYTANTPYARAVVDGSRPHIIQPRQARALYWVDGAGGHYARLVHHPGTKPNRFAHRAVRPLVPLLSQRLARIVETQLKRG